MGCGTSALEDHRRRRNSLDEALGTPARQLDWKSDPSPNRSVRKKKPAGVWEYGVKLSALVEMLEKVEATGLLAKDGDTTQEEVSTREVMERFVLPRVSVGKKEGSGAQCRRYTDLLHKSQVVGAEVLVSHSPSCGFKDLVLALKTHFKFEEKVEVRSTPVFLDILASSPQDAASFGEEGRDVQEVVGMSELVRRTQRTVVVVGRENAALSDMRVLHAIWLSVQLRGEHTLEVALPNSGGAGIVAAPSEQALHETESDYLVLPPMTQVEKFQAGVYVSLSEARCSSNRVRDAVLRELLGNDQESELLVNLRNSQLRDALLRSVVLGQGQALCLSHLRRGDHLRSQGRYTQAYSAFEEGLEAATSTRDWVDEEQSPQDGSGSAAPKCQAPLREEGVALGRMGAVLCDQGRFQEARPHLERALEVVERVHGSEHCHVAGALCQLAAAVEEGDGCPLAMAESLYRRALWIYQGGSHQAPGGEVLSTSEFKRRPELNQTLTDLGRVLVKQNKLDDAQAMLQQALDLSIEVHGSLHTDVACCYSGMGHLFRRKQDYAKSREMYERALTIRENLYGTGPPNLNVASSLDDLALLFTEQNLFADALKVRLRCVEIQEAAYSELQHPSLAASLANLALLHKSQGKLAVAEPLYRRSLHILENTLGPLHLRVGAALNNLAELLRTQGRLHEAEGFFLRSVAIFENHFGVNHPSVATALNNLAVVYRTQCRHSEAEELYTRSLKIREATLGPDHPALAVILNNLAVVLEKQGKIEEAEPLQRRALAIRETALGLVNAEVAGSVNNLAVLLKKQGRLQEAESLYRRGLQLFKQLYGEDHPGVAGSLNNLAGVLKHQGNLHEALPLYRQSLALRERVAGASHPDVEASLGNLAGLLREMGQLGEVPGLLKRQLAILEGCQESVTPRVIQTYQALAQVLQEMGKLGDARDVLLKLIKLVDKPVPKGEVNEQALEVRDLVFTLMSSVGMLEELERLVRNWLAQDKKTHSEFHEASIRDLNMLALVLYKQGREEEATRVMQRALQATKRAKGNNHPMLADMLISLAEWRTKQDRHKESEVMLRHALTIREQAYEADHPLIAGALMFLGRSLRLQSRLDDAAPLLLRALTMNEKLLGHDHPETLVCKSQLTACASGSQLNAIP